MRRKPGLGEWMIGSCGGRVEDGGGDGPGRTQMILLSFLLTLICKGDSYPETCAQRNDEGGGSCVGIYGRGLDRSLLSFFHVVLLPCCLHTSSG
jgi:hypothetical protein